MLWLWLVPIPELELDIFEAEQKDQGVSLTLHTLTVETINSRI